MARQKRIGTSRFGWCLGHPSEQQHDKCWITVDGLRCGCPCHEEA